MNSRADELRLARESYSVAWRDFIRLSNDEPNLLCCFFEGEDDKYYGIRIELLLGSKYRAFQVGGRSGVLKILELVSTADRGFYAKRPVAFFIDQDYFSPSIKDSRVYVTPCYSIENFYASVSCFEKIISTEFGIRYKDEDHNNVMSCYKTSLASFNSSTQLLNAWLRQQKSIELSCPPEKRPKSINLGKVEEFVQFSLPTCASTYDVDSLDARYKRVSTPEAKAAMNVWINDTSLNPEQAHRGKFLMEFLCKFITWLLNDVTSDSPKLVSRKLKVHLTFQHRNAISQFSQYADTPRCLSDFLQNVKRRIEEIEPLRITPAPAVPAASRKARASRP